MTVTLDASVWVAARFESEPGQTDSTACLRHVLSSGETIAMPWLAWVEIVAAVARKTDSEALAQEVGRRLLDLPVIDWSDLDESGAAEAVQLAAKCRLRAADAVYAAVARRHSATLVTMDLELRRRCAPHVRCQLPAEWVRSHAE